MATVARRDIRAMEGDNNAMQGPGTDDNDIISSCQAIPAGRWAVGVSGGLDSTTLLLCLHDRPDLWLHAAHLNHELRGQAADADADFVRQLAGRLGVECTILRRHDIEPQMPDLPANPSAKYRALRLAFFARLIRQHDLQGVILAHHADDQAETVLFRLLRGSSWEGLTGMKPDIRIQGVRILRPLLSLRKEVLADYLRRRQQSWREDASNASSKYARNRVRQLLARHPNLMDTLLPLQAAAGDLHEWVASAAPVLDSSFTCADLDRMPALLAHHAAGQWLIAQGVPMDRVTQSVISCLRRMAGDAATPATQDFPGNIRILRWQGRIRAANRPVRRGMPE